MRNRLLLVLLLTAACAPAGSRTAPAPAAGPSSRMAPDSFLVTFTTSKGDFDVIAHRAWSPLAVDRFYQLIRAHTFDDVRIFRMVPGFVAQFGLTGDSARDNLWIRARVPDEPVVVPNTRGRMSFARGGPGTRTLQVFINLGNNSRSLDNMVVGGVRGYPPFAEVVRGMDVVDRFEGKYEDQPTAHQPEISAYGWAWLDSHYPGLDRIRSTRIVREWKGK